MLLFGNGISLFSTEPDLLASRRDHDRGLSGLPARSALNVVADVNGRNICN
jgi:hypothetical protein